MHIDAEEVEKWIDECEHLFIVPAIGAEMYARLTSGEILTEQEEMLLEGGAYVQKGKGTALFKGLRWALGYYVLAKMIRNDGGLLSRGGFFRHEDEYGSRLDDKNNVNRYNDAMNVADSYLNGALLYMSTWKDDCKVEKVRGSRVRIISVGD